MITSKRRSPGSKLSSGTSWTSRPSVSRACLAASADSSRPGGLVAALARLVEQHAVAAAHVQQGPVRHVAADLVEQPAGRRAAALLLDQVVGVAHVAIQLVERVATGQRGLLHGARTRGTRTGRRAGRCRGRSARSSPPRVRRACRGSAAPAVPSRSGTGLRERSWANHPRKVQAIDHGLLARGRRASRAGRCGARDVGGAAGRPRRRGRSRPGAAGRA